MMYSSNALKSKFNFFTNNGTNIVYYLVILGAFRTNQDVQTKQLYFIN